jgi:FG-GAP-like repeat
VNGDGKVDLISVNFNANSLSVYTNSGAGHFGLFDTLGTGNNPAAVTAADINGDGKPDLICANETDSTLSVLLDNLPGGRLTLTFAGTVGSVSWPVPFGGNYTLQTSTNLTTANWQAVNTAIVTNSVGYKVAITNASSSRFFRLLPK